MSVGLSSGCFKVLIADDCFGKTQVSTDEAPPLADLRAIRWLDDSAPNGQSVNRILLVSGTEGNASSDNWCSGLEV